MAGSRVELLAVPQRCEEIEMVPEGIPEAIAEPAQH